MDVPTAETVEVPDEAATDPPAPRAEAVPVPEAAPTDENTAAASAAAAAAPDEEPTPAEVPAPTADAVATPDEAPAADTIPRPADEADPFPAAEPTLETTDAPVADAVEVPDAAPTASVVPDGSVLYRTTSEGLTAVVRAMIEMTWGVSTIGATTRTFVEVTSPTTILTVLLSPDIPAPPYGVGIKLLTVVPARSVVVSRYATM